MSEITLKAVINSLNTTKKYLAQIEIVPYGYTVVAWNENAARLGNGTDNIEWANVYKDTSTGKFVIKNGDERIELSKKLYKE